jgi:predicted Rossmann fold flavoprotein
MIYDIVIVGAGASGLALASSISNKSICIIDSNARIGEKIRISGGGKCNFTNSNINSSKYVGNKRILEHSFKNFSNNDFINLLENNNIRYRLNERLVKGAYFCYKSEDIINLFYSLIQNHSLMLNTKVIDIDSIDNIFHIITDKKTLLGKKVVIASGGLSFSILNSSDIGYKIAKKFGHNISKLSPALVGFTVQKEQFWFKELSGLSIKDVVITIGEHKCKGDFLFTFRGCSGPVILISSLYWEKGSISIDFLANSKEVPKRFRQVFEKYAKTDMRNYTFSPAGTFGYSKAEVTKGGIAVNELTSKMESKYQKNLYFIGEVLDITGELGGYNIQWAISSAMKVEV